MNNFIHINFLILLGDFVMYDNNYFIKIYNNLFDKVKESKIEAQKLLKGDLHENNNLFNINIKFEPFAEIEKIILAQIFESEIEKNILNYLKFGSAIGGLK